MKIIKMTEIENIRLVSRKITEVAAWGSLKYLRKIILIKDSITSKAILQNWRGEKDIFKQTKLEKYISIRSGLWGYCHMFWKPERKLIMIGRKQEFIELIGKNTDTSSKYSSIIHTEYVSYVSLVWRLKCKTIIIRIIH